LLSVIVSISLYVSLCLYVCLCVCQSVLLATTDRTVSIDVRVTSKWDVIRSLVCVGVVQELQAITVNSVRTIQPRLCSHNCQQRAYHT